MHVPDSRVRRLNEAPIASAGDYVLYWMVAARRPRFNFALERAALYARELGKPLLVFEPLRASYPWASERLHTFVVEGMAANQAHFAKRAVSYFPYLEPRRGAGAGLLAALAARAALVITDDFPCFFIPHMTALAAKQLSVRVEAIDGNGVLPLSLAEGKTFYNAFHFRRFAQRHLARELAQAPREDPLRRLALARLAELPRAITRRWRPTSEEELAHIPRTIAKLPVSTRVRAVAALPGGHLEAKQRLSQFIKARLSRYANERSHPDSDVASGLSPYLHFGHLGVHEIVDALKRPEQWDGLPRGLEGQGARTGFWGLTAAAEGFLDEVVTFRELAFNTAATLPNFDRYETLPNWAQKTLGEHEGDRREHIYSREQLERGETHDLLWNAAQRQLVHEGRIQNYLRMLWGKQILAFTTSPRSALETMIELNNRYALDGRDPNSYAGFFWVLGRYDRPWAPERAVFGSVRYMSSAASARKLRLKNYLLSHGGAKHADQRRGTPQKNRRAE
jgi:deoxyribodipyrimidine photo-lyase